MIRSNQFGNLDKKMVYGMSLELDINENQSWNPLDMWKQREHLVDKQIQKFKLPQLSKMPDLPSMEFKVPKSEAITKCKTIINYSLS